MADRESASSQPSNPRSESDEGLQHVVAAEDGAPALVPAAGLFEGQVVVQGPTRIEGAVRGALRGPGQLAVGPGGRIEGAIECADLHSQGLITGSIEAAGGVWLAPGSRSEGPLRAATLALDESAILNGQTRVGSEKGER